jgi:hypothetical protein
MFIYVLIAVELAILYTAFWYVYVREPRPIRIRGNRWGGYTEGELTAGGIGPTLPFLSALSQRDLPTTERGLAETIDRQTLSMLPAWLVGNPTITQEFLQAWRMLRSGELTGTGRPTEQPRYLQSRSFRYQGRRAKRCHSRLLKLLCGRRNGGGAPAPRPPLLSRLMKIVTRTFRALRTRHV